MMKMINGFFKDLLNAEQAYNFAAAACYGKDEINIVMSEDTLNKFCGNDKKIINEVNDNDLSICENEIASHVLGINTKVPLKELTLVVSGPLAPGLAVAAEEKVVTNLTHALSILEIGEKDFTIFEQAIKNGGILIGVRPRSEIDAQRFEHEWRMMHLPI